MKRGLYEVHPLDAFYLLRLWKQPEVMEISLESRSWMENCYSSDQGNKSSAERGTERMAFKKKQGGGCVKQGDFSVTAHASF